MLVKHICQQLHDLSTVSGRRLLQMAYEAKLTHSIPMEETLYVVLLILDLVKIELLENVFPCLSLVRIVELLKHFQEVLNALIVV